MAATSAAATPPRAAHVALRRLKLVIAASPPSASSVRVRRLVVICVLSVLLRLCVCGVCGILRRCVVCGPSPDEVSVDRGYHRPRDPAVSRHRRRSLCVDARRVGVVRGGQVQPRAGRAAPPASTWTVWTKDGRQPLATTSAGGREMVSLDELTRLFGARRARGRGDPRPGHRRAGPHDRRLGRPGPRLDRRARRHAVDAAAAIGPHVARAARLPRSRARAGLPAAARRAAALASRRRRRRARAAGHRAARHGAEPGAGGRRRPARRRRTPSCRSRGGWSCASRPRRSISSSPPRPRPISCSALRQLPGRAGVRHRPRPAIRLVSRERRPARGRRRSGSRSRSRAPPSRRRRPQAPQAAAAPAAPGRPAPPPPLTVEPVASIRTVVIDPGHGGEEEGAKGPAGTLEKHVALSVVEAVEERARSATRRPRAADA